MEGEDSKWSNGPYQESSYKYIFQRRSVMNEQKLRVGNIGLGRMSFVYNHALQQVKDMCELYAVCDVIEEKVNARLKRGIWKKGYTDYQDLCRDPNVDVILITVPHAGIPEVEDPHYEVAKAALQNKKHVLVEKPMTVTEVHARELIDIAKKNEVKFTTAENTRFVPGYMEAARLVEDGTLGDILFVRTEIDGSSIEELHNRENWLGKKPNGGVILDMGVHTFYLLKWIFDGVTDISAFSHKIIPEAELEDNGVFTGHLKKGTYFLSTVSTIAKVPWTERLEIYGSKAALIVDHLLDPTAVLYIGPDEKIERKPLETVPYEPQMWKWKSMLAEVVDFLEAVRDDRNPQISAEDGLYAVKLAEAAYESARTGHTVPVE
jgi:predicted dehydrogenase